jgi:hypothetical protein
MNFYVTWTTSSRISLQETLGPFHMLEAAEREMEFVSTDPRIKVWNIKIVQGD